MQVAVYRAKRSAESDSPAKTSGTIMRSPPSASASSTSSAGSRGSESSPTGTATDGNALRCGSRSLPESTTTNYAGERAFERGLLFARANRTSTQEQAWLLMAAEAAVRESGGTMTTAVGNAAPQTSGKPVYVRRELGSGA